MEKATDHELRRLNDNLRKQNSLKEGFKRGLVHGLGAALGASIVAAVALAILAKVINTVDNVPFVEDIIEKSQVKDAVSR